MKRLIPLLLLFLLASAAWAQDASRKAIKQLDKATDVLNEIMKIPEKGIPHDLLGRAVCVGIVPAELRFAIGFGGTYGRGVLVCRRGGNGPWGAPSMFRLGGANIGFQLGGRATDVVFIVMNAGGAMKLAGNNVKLGADASATAGPVGRTAEGATDAQMRAEILSYSRTRGLFAGVSLAGSFFKQDVKDNYSLYGKKLSPKDIVIKGKTGVPAAARPLVGALSRYSSKGGQPFPKS
ncbi:MAG TPA: lipid-binding SYLF domain-containing protein [Terriglobia bacterium]|nr:lipid-binding SYLF domain-containing protein [Terriglobia bacterium]